MTRKKFSVAQLKKCKPDASVLLPSFSFCPNIKTGVRAPLCYIKHNCLDPSFKRLAFYYVSHANLQMADNLKEKLFFCYDMGGNLFILLAWFEFV